MLFPCIIALIILQKLIWVFSFYFDLLHWVHTLGKIRIKVLDLLLFRLLNLILLNNYLLIFLYLTQIMLEFLFDKSGLGIGIVQTSNKLFYHRNLQIILFITIWSSGISDWSGFYSCISIFVMLFWFSYSIFIIFQFFHTFLFVLNHIISLQRYGLCWFCAIFVS